MIHDTKEVHGPPAGHLSGGVYPLTSSQIQQVDKARHGSMATIVISKIHNIVLLFLAHFSGAPSSGIAGKCQSGHLLQKALSRLSDFQKAHNHPESRTPSRRTGLTQCKGCKTHQFNFEGGPNCGPTGSNQQIPDGLVPPQKEVLIEVTFSCNPQETHAIWLSHSDFATAHTGTTPPKLNFDMLRNIHPTPPKHPPKLRPDRCPSTAALLRRGRRARRRVIRRAADALRRHGRGPRGGVGRGDAAALSGGAARGCLGEGECWSGLAEGGLGRTEESCGSLCLFRRSGWSVWDGNWV